MEQGKQVGGGAEYSNSGKSSRPGGLQEDTAKPTRPSLMVRTTFPAQAVKSGSLSHSQAVIPASHQPLRQSPESWQDASTDMADQVEQRSATHFAVIPGLRITKFRRWQERLLEYDRRYIMTAYLDYEYDRILTRMMELKKRYDTLNLPKIITDSSAGRWDERLKQTSEAAVAACLHKAAWNDNYRWLQDAELDNVDEESRDSDSTELANRIFAMTDALEEAMDRAKRARLRSESSPSAIDGVPTPIEHTRLRELRGQETRSDVRTRSEARRRHRKRQRKLERSMTLGTTKDSQPSPTSPLCEERGHSPDSLTETLRAGADSEEVTTDSTGSPLAKRYTFEVFGPIDHVEIGFVLRRLADLELEQG